MPKNPNQDEEKLEKEVDQMTKGRPSYNDRDKTDLREHLRVRLYEGQYVLFRDHYEGQSPDVFLARREILCHSPRREEVYSVYDSLSEQDRKGVNIDYIAPHTARPRGR